MIHPGEPSLINYVHIIGEMIITVPVLPQKPHHAPTSQPFYLLFFLARGLKEEEKTVFLLPC